MVHVHLARHCRQCMIVCVSAASVGYGNHWASPCDAYFAAMHCMPNSLTPQPLTQTICIVVFCLTCQPFCNKPLGLAISPTVRGLCSANMHCCSSTEQLFQFAHALTTAGLTCREWFWPPHLPGLDTVMKQVPKLGAGVSAQCTCRIFNRPAA